MVAINLSSFENLISIMYKDKVSVERLTNFTEPDETTSQKYILVPEYVDLPCKLSWSRIDSATVPTSGVDTNPTSSQPQLFYPLKYDIKKGDRLSIQVIGSENQIIQKIIAIAGTPNVFQINKQVEVSIEED